MSKADGVCQIVSSFYPVVGGVERATGTLCRALASSGMDVVVLTRRYPSLSRKGGSPGVRVHRLGFPGRGKLAAFSFAVHALLILVFRLRRFRVVHVQNIDTPLLIGLVGKALLGRRLVTTIHGEAKIREKRRSKLGRMRLALLRSLGDRFVAISAAMREELIEEGLLDGRVRHIPNGIDLATYTPAALSEKRRARARLNLPESELITLYLGRLISVKGVELLLRAWADLPRIGERRLIVVGDGPDAQRLRTLAIELDLAGVRFDGVTDDPLSYLQAADVFVLPSRQEGLSVALLEAMATGLCAVVSDLPGHRFVIRHRRTGLVFPVEDLGALKRCLDEALSRSEFRRCLGREAREAVMRKCSVQRVAERHRALYQELLPRTGPKMTNGPSLARNQHRPVRKPSAATR